MIDFTSASYLGFEHRQEELEPWTTLSTGKPAELWEPEPARRLAAELAELQGCEAGLIAPSTLHLFWDVPGWAARAGMEVFVDAGAYPIGVSMVPAAVRFRHRDVNDLELQLRGRGRPLVLVDGFCPVCQAIFPFADLLACVRRAGGLVLVDDTQALGIFGSPGGGLPYGRGGGGSLRHAGLEREDGVLAISSLAKAFGAPLAVLVGPARRIRQFAEVSRSRIHCSPPSMAAVAAGLAALDRNRREGDRRRKTLAALVARLKPRRGLFPYQIFGHSKARQLHRTLLAEGMETVLLTGQPEQLGIAIMARHQPSDIDALTRRISLFLEEPCLACS